jgi:hypothetical protein
MKLGYLVRLYVTPAQKYGCSRFPVGISSCDRLPATSQAGDPIHNAEGGE